MRWIRRGPRQMALPGMQTARTKGRRQPDGSRKSRSRLRLVSEPVSRRGFLSGTLGWISAAIAASLGIPGLTAVAAAAFRKSEDAWSPIGRLGKPGPDEPDLTVVGKPMLTSFRTLREDAYMKAQPQNVPVYVINHGGGKFTVFDVRCTHLGCPVTWEGGAKQFKSPCHNGLFAADGRVVGGPPPRPLDRYDWKLEDGVLFVGALHRGDEKPAAGKQGGRRDVHAQS